MRLTRAGAIPNIRHSFSTGVSLSQPVIISHVSFNALREPSYYIVVPHTWQRRNKSSPTQYVRLCFRCCACELPDNVDPSTNIGFSILAVLLENKGAYHVQVL